MYHSLLILVQTDLYIDSRYAAIEDDTWSQELEMPCIEAQDHETNNHRCPSEEEGKSNVWYWGRG